MVYSFKKIASTRDYILAHVYVESHLSIKHTSQQVLESGYRWENMGNDISEMISLCEMCGARKLKSRKNCNKAYREL